VREVFEIDRAQFMPPPKVGQGIDTRLLLGIARYGELFIMLLDSGRLFSDDDLELLKDMAEPEDATPPEALTAAV